MDSLFVRQRPVVHRRQSVDVDLHKVVEKAGEKEKRQSEPEKLTRETAFRRLAKND